MIAQVHADFRHLGFLAGLTGKKYKLCVLRSAAGYYIGTQVQGSPYTRESAEYWQSYMGARDALDNHRWTQREQF